MVGELSQTGPVLAAAAVGEGVAGAAGVAALDCVLDAGVADCSESLSPRHPISWVPPINIDAAPASLARKERREVCIRLPQRFGPWPFAMTIA
jgi:hypothetical protein